jgi:Mg2+-importing ATPase
MTAYYLTFGVLLLFLNATTAQFRTGWFLESVVSATMIVLVMRTRKPFFRSRPSKYLTLATLLVVAVTLFLPYTPVADLLGLTPMPPSFLLVLAAIVVLYVFSAEVAKSIFYKRTKF